jgi:hypothetical protein
LRVTEGAGTGAREVVVTTRASTSYGQRLTDVRLEQPFVLETLEGGVQGAGRVVTPGALDEVSPNSESVCVCSKASNGEQHRELEAAD